MHYAHSLRRLTVFLVLCIGSFHGALNAEVEEPDLEKLQKEHLVYVEPKDEKIKVGETGEVELSPYLKRRGKWGLLFGADYSTYEPLNYQPNYAVGNYRSVYGTPGTPMTEVNLQVKRNLSPISFGGELSVGFFQNAHSDPALVNSVLGLTQARIGAIALLETLSPDPMFVPYVSGGGYIMFFKETLGGNAFSGNTQFAPYVNGGVAMTIDWLDHQSANEGFEESGLQSTFVFLEVRKYFASAKKQDPDFSNTANLTAGLRVEF